MRLVSWNVNGVRAAYRKDFAEWLGAERADVICLQETKAHPSQLGPEIVQPAGFHSCWSSAERKGYSGVAVYSRVEPRAWTRGLGVPRFDAEGRLIEADFGAFVLFNVYYPNGGMGPERLAYKLDFYDAFLERAEALRAQGRELVVCGDYNTAHHEIDLARPKENATVSGFLPEERVWLDKLEGLGYVDTFRRFCGDPERYTFWDMKSRARERNVGWRIDYFWVTPGLLPALVSASIDASVMGSDHCPIAIELNLDVA